ncbi:MAG: 3-oxoadipate enol-lactonase [Alphaproteobacteria bacterium]|nr:MAG: 3-oxoadipate enol-lactonase [Alphaproteobacteria bacterium]
MKIAAVNGIRCHYDESGDPAGRPLVLIHPLGTDFRIWDRLLPLLPQDMRIIRYDLRGHGLSECPAAPYTMEMLGEDAAALLDHLGVRGAVVLGISIGGIVAQQLAATRPDLVAALVLCCTAARIGTAEFWDARIEAIHRGGIAALEEQILSRWFTEAFRSSHRDELAGWRHMLCRTPEDGYLGCSYALKSVDLTGQTAGLRLPALAIAGELDAATPPETVRELAESIPGCEFAVIEGAGHIPPVETPEALAEILTPFLQRVRDAVA